MEEGKELIKKGLDYCKHVEGYQTSKLLSEAILVNMAGMAGECLLGGLSRLHNLEASHGNISSHLSVLQYKLPVPVEVSKASRYIEQKTATCGVSAIASEPIELAEIAAHLSLIKEWVLEVSS